MNHKKIAKSELSNADKILLEAASEATKLSYSPYSNFKVGSALLLSNNEIIKGANIENASYPLSMCAERTALYNAKMNHQSESVVKIAVTAKGEKELENFINTKTPYWIFLMMKLLKHNYIVIPIGTT